MKQPVISILYLILAGLFLCCTADTEPSPPKVQFPPPFNGTIFLDPDILTSSDPTTFTTLTYTGQAQRKMFDRRVNDWITTNPFLFKANYNDGLSIEFQINPEFKTVAEAQVQALNYAEVIGRLPTVLRKDVKTSWIHLGTQPFGGGNNNLLIHIGQSMLYEKDGILEETFIHEAAHTSLDAAHAASKGWISAQNTDPSFISTYALDNPRREDIAETFLLYVALRYRSDRISASLRDKILETVPNRLKYFDSQNFNMSPIK
ncbi:MAG: hypothetical protein NBV61_05245 [Algoriphagus sp.]|nr:hypothetical protein [Algoriphagus sp.]